MKNLLIKEFKLSAHPTCYIFLLLPLMLLIPNYPYTVTYFYFALAIFFTCTLGRESNDIGYMMMLPISRKDIVKARIAFTVILELASIIISVPFIIIRQTVMTAPNLGGFDANIALVGFALLLYSIFNTVFFINYYKDVKKPGISFVISSAALLLYVVIGEVVDHIMPIFVNVLDTPDSTHITEKVILDIICIIIYVLTLIITYKKSVSLFSKLDIN